MNLTQLWKGHVLQITARFTGLWQKKLYLCNYQDHQEHRPA